MTRAAKGRNPAGYRGKHHKVVVHVSFPVEVTGKAACETVLNALRSSETCPNVQVGMMPNKERKWPK